jgi:cation diffusion facilitator CzcD-associated flavoprotein CzcO
VGCKRVLLSSDYYPALTRPNVELVTDPITEVSGRSILTEDGAEREVDAIVLGTGFSASEPEYATRIRGRDGATLSEVWGGTPEAYLGLSVSGFPNMFLVLGPNTGLGHSSALDIIESGAAYIADAVDWTATRGVGAVDVRSAEQARYNDEIQRRLSRSVWQAGGCRSWYQDANGRNTALWPGFAFRYRQATARFRPSAYEMPLAGSPAGAARV